MLSNEGFLVVYLKIGKVNVCYSTELTIKSPHIRGLSVRINGF